MGAFIGDFQEYQFPAGFYGWGGSWFKELRFWSFRALGAKEADNDEDEDDDEDEWS